MNKEQEVGIKARLFEITGDTDNIEQALDQWMQERQAFGEIHSENEQLVKQDKKTKLVIAQASATINKIELEANMFIKPATRAQIQKFRLMCKNLADGRDLDETPRAGQENDSDANQNP